ncbi:MAG TPA: SHOCT domain-containing protein [Gaiellaceae bacterium]|nr:SHOCT domain-containing protein [Gaiellaceae bacterium]
MLGAIIQVLISGFVIGALARWAVPGPDPMSVPMTILLGVFGSFLGGGIAAAIFGAQQDSGSIFAILIGSILASMLLLIGYRRFVQKRPITGPEAQRAPSERAHFGTLLGAPGGQAERQDDVAEQLRKLEELHRDGVLTDEEFEAKKAELLARS